jgi:cytochrome c-type biogenesis protein CcsB
MTEQLGITLFRMASWVYLIASVCYVAFLLNKQKGVAKLGFAFLCIAILIHTASLVIVTAAAGRPPFLNLPEYAFCFVWAVAVVYAVFEYRTKFQVLGALALPLMTIAAFYAYKHLHGEIQDVVMPALNSFWRVPHVGTAILAYASFTLAFVLGILYLLRQRSEGKKTSFWGSRLPSLEQLDQLTYRTVAFGFLMQTAMVLTGAVWAQFAWGRYWGWDPKETWSMITWLIYAAYLHTRTTKGWRGRKSAIVAIFGFLAVLFTFFGITYILSGLHSYG